MVYKFADNQVAGYLHEIADDIIVTHDQFQQLRLDKIAIQQYWSKYIHKFTTGELAEIEKYYRGKILLIHAPTGNQSLDQDLLYQYFNTCTQLDVKYLQVGIGNQTLPPKDLETWIGYIADLAGKYSVTPLIEISSQTPMNRAVGIVSILNKYPLRILYDPAQFVQMGCLDHFFRYWSLLHSKVPILEIRDYKVTKGPKPPGFGDCDLSKFIKSVTRKDLWYLIETGLGSRYQMITGKVNIFRACYFAFKELCDKSREIRNVHKHQ